LKTAFWHKIAQNIPKLTLENGRLCGRKQSMKMGDELHSYWAAQVELRSGRAKGAYLAGDSGGGDGGGGGSVRVAAEFSEDEYKGLTDELTEEEVDKEEEVEAEEVEVEVESDVAGGEGEGKGEE